jgi:hypothetical protein
MQKKNQSVDDYVDNFKRYQKISENNIANSVQVRRFVEGLLRHYRRPLLPNISRFNHLRDAIREAKELEDADKADNSSTSEDMTTEDDSSDEVSGKAVSSDSSDSERYQRKKNKKKANNKKKGSKKSGGRNRKESLKFIEDLEDSFKNLGKEMRNVVRDELTRNSAKKTTSNGDSTLEQKQDKTDRLAQDIAQKLNVLQPRYYPSQYPYVPPQGSPIPPPMMDAPYYVNPNYPVILQPPTQQQFGSYPNPRPYNYNPNFGQNRPPPTSNAQGPRRPPPDSRSGNQNQGKANAQSNANVNYLDTATDSYQSASQNDMEYTDNFYYVSTVDNSKLVQVSGSITGTVVKMLVDTGASCSLIHRKLLEFLQTQPYINALIRPAQAIVRVGDGGAITCDQECTLEISLDGYCYYWFFLVMDHGHQFDLLLGNDFRKAYEVQLLRYKGEDRLIPLYSGISKDIGAIILQHEKTAKEIQGNIYRLRKVPEELLERMPESTQEQLKVLIENHKYNAQHLMESYDPDAWHLNATWFLKANEIWGPHDVHIGAATKHHSVLSNFKSDFVMRHWMFADNLFCTPRFHDFRNFLNWLHEGNRACTVLVPIFKNRRWFPEILSMMADFPLILPRVPTVHLLNGEPVGRPRFHTVILRIDPVHERHLISEEDREFIIDKLKGWKMDDIHAVGIRQALQNRRIERDRIIGKEIHRSRQEPFYLQESQTQQAG